MQSMFKKVLTALTKPKAALADDKRATNGKQTVNKPGKSPEYFEQAKSWADDMYTSAIASRNRYKTAFYWAAAIASCLALAIMMLVPLQHTELVIVHQADNGVVWVEPSSQEYKPENSAQVESELVRYVINRESYSAASYDEQYSLVTLLSGEEPAKDYMDEQSLNNKYSPINVLGKKGARSVHIENVVFLDSPVTKKSAKKDRKEHKNLAQVNFLVTEHTITGKQVSIPLTAIIAWQYKGTPHNPADMWRNFNGFTVTGYVLQQRNLKRGE